MVVVRRPRISKEKHPDGLHQAVCVDAIDLGLMENRFEPGEMTHKVAFRFETAERDSEGLPIRVRTRDLTLSFGERANLRKLLEKWRGRKFTDLEMDAGFDLDDMIGIPAMINVTHEEGRDGNTYVFVSDVFRDTNEQKYRPIGDYERQKAKPKRQEVVDSEKQPRKVKQGSHAQAPYDNANEPWPDDEEPPF